jgi:HEAT repeat protein
MKTHWLLAGGVLLLVSGLAVADDKKDIEDLVKTLQSKDDKDRSKAAADLVLRKKEAVPALVKRLDKGTDETRGLVLAVLSKIGPDAADAVPALRKLIEGDPEAKKISTVLAIQTLGRIGPKAKESVPTLIEALKSKEARSPLRIAAAMALGRIGPPAKEAVPALRAAMKEKTAKSGPLRFHAAAALGQIGPAAKAAVPDLIELLKDENVGPARLVAAQALGGIGSAAQEALPALTTAAGNQDDALRSAATAALAKIQRRK